MYQPRTGSDQSRKSQSISSASLVYIVTRCPGQGEKNKVRRFWKAACQAEILLWPFFFNATISLFLFNMKNWEKGVN